MRVVIDVSLTMAWGFEDEATAAADDVLDRVASEGALVPPLWAYEVANVLAVAERRGRVSIAQSGRFTTLLSQLPIVVAEPLDPGALATAARTHGLSAYDAAYLALALREGVPLATLDDRLAGVARKAGVEVLPAR